jgi:hypothetical protein
VWIGEFQTQLETAGKELMEEWKRFGEEIGAELKARVDPMGSCNYSPTLDEPGRRIWTDWIGFAR